MWRPDGEGPVCSFTFRGETCGGEGPHRCVPRADKVVAFFAELLVHVKGKWNRQAFVLSDWQEQDIVRPLFGEVVYSDEHERYVRRYTKCYIVIPRKNGKSSLASGIALYLMVGDDEAAAEVYGGAKDTKQAGKVFEPAVRMMKLSPVLSDRLGYNKNNRRIYDEQTGSYYETITSDAKGELGHNPHGFILDELLSQLDGHLAETMATAAGTRVQPLQLYITTETNEPSSWAASEIDEAEKIDADPSRAPHVFTYVSKLDRDADPWDEDNWYEVNPALGDFLSVKSLRQEALEAKNQPAKENAFRQYRLNQRVQQTTRFLPLHIWDENVGEVAASSGWLDSKLAGRLCWGGLDLSSKEDLTAWCLLFEDGQVRWRFWIPEVQVAEVDRFLGGKLAVWARDGWVTVTDGNVIDYQRIYREIEEDCNLFAVSDVTYDKWMGEPVRQELEARTGVVFYESSTTYSRMTAPTTELMALLKDRQLRHGGNPVARWHADSLEVKHPSHDASRVRPTKPERHNSGKRVDGMVALIMAIDGRMSSTTRSSAPATLVGFN